jgi:hypothetical protein
MSPKPGTNPHQNLNKYPAGYPVTKEQKASQEAERKAIEEKRKSEKSD